MQAALLRIEVAKVQLKVSAGLAPLLKYGAHQIWSVHCRAPQGMGRLLCQPAGMGSPAGLSVTVRGTPFWAPGHRTPARRPVSPR